MKMARSVWNCASCDVGSSFGSAGGEGMRGDVRRGDRGGLDLACAGVEGSDGDAEMGVEEGGRSK